MTEKTIKELESCGFKVKIKHHRIREFLFNLKDANIKVDEFGNVKQELNGRIGLSQYGGRTVVKLISNGTEYVGESICNKHDRFVKSTGLKIAIGRALKKVENNEKS